MSSAMSVIMTVMVELMRGSMAVVSSAQLRCAMALIMTVTR
jgi:hypothetical protein